MSSGLIALLDDIAVIARSAAASLDDIGSAVGTAGSKAAGVVIDDAAVTPRYVSGLTPDRELPIIGKIALGSLKNKLLILLPISLLLSAFLPWAITPLLMLGGTYLAYEATEKVIELFLHDHHDQASLAEADTPQELEARQVAGAIRTDLILSAEIMTIALASLGGATILNQAIVLAIVGVGITVGVYGAVAIVVKLDDIGLDLAQTGTQGLKAFGRWLVSFVPSVLSLLSNVGTAAMLWVGGGILIHGMKELGLPQPAHLIEMVGEAAGEGSGIVADAVALVVGALLSALVALLVGAAIVGSLHLIGRKVVHEAPAE